MIFNFTEYDTENNRYVIAINQYNIVQLDPTNYPTHIPLKPPYQTHNLQLHLLIGQHIWQPLPEAQLKHQQMYLQMPFACAEQCASISPTETPSSAPSSTHNLA